MMQLWAGSRRVDMKFPKLFIIYMLIAIPVIFFVLISTATGTTISYQGFAFDRNDNLYLGMDGKIRVIDPQGDIIREFSPKTSRGYSFTIQNETLWVDIGEYIYKLDLEGNLIEKTESEQIPYSERPVISRRRFISETNTTYIMRSPFLRSKIYRLEGKKRIELYRMPVHDYIVKCLSFLYGLSMFIVIPISVYQVHRKAYGNKFKPFGK